MSQLKQIVIGEYYNHFQFRFVMFPSEANMLRQQNSIFYVSKRNRRTGIHGI